MEPRASVVTIARPEFPVTHHRTTTVDGIEIFDREAGPDGAPAVVLLHGFPTSSHMFRNLIPALADRYRVIAPDYPGFGLSAMPDRKQFDYTFTRSAELVDKLLAQRCEVLCALRPPGRGAPSDSTPATSRSRTSSTRWWR